MVGQGDSKHCGPIMASQHSHCRNGMSAREWQGGGAVQNMVVVNCKWASERVGAVKREVDEVGSPDWVGSASAGGSGRWSGVTA